MKEDYKKAQEEARMNKKRLYLIKPGYLRNPLLAYGDKEPCLCLSGRKFKNCCKKYVNPYLKEKIAGSIHGMAFGDMFYTLLEKYHKGNFVLTDVWKRLNHNIKKLNENLDKTDPIKEN